MKVRILHVINQFGYGEALTAVTNIAEKTEVLRRKFDGDNQFKHTEDIYTSLAQRKTKKYPQNKREFFWSKRPAQSYSI